MPVITVSDEVYKVLSDHFENYQDTPANIIKKLLLLVGWMEENEEQLSSTETLVPSLPRSSLLKSEFYEHWLLYILENFFSGRGATSKVINKTIEAMKEYDLLAIADFSQNRSGQIRVRNRIAFVREHLKARGYIKHPMEARDRGFWELTELGRNVAKTITPPKDRSNSPGHVWVIDSKHTTQTK